MVDRFDLKVFLVKPTKNIYTYGILPSKQISHFLLIKMVQQTTSTEIYIYRSGQIWSTKYSCVAPCPRQTEIRFWLCCTKWSSNLFSMPGDGLFLEATFRGRSRVVGSMGIFIRHQPIPVRGCPKCGWGEDNRLEELLQWGLLSWGLLPLGDSQCTEQLLLGLEMCLIKGLQELGLKDPCWGHGVRELQGLRLFIQSLRSAGCSLYPQQRWLLNHFSHGRICPLNDWSPFSRFSTASL